eukprot:gene4514-14675_t
MEDRHNDKVLDELATLQAFQASNYRPSDRDIQLLESRLAGGRSGERSQAVSPPRVGGGFDFDPVSGKSTVPRSGRATPAVRTGPGYYFRGRDQTTVRRGEKKPSWSAGPGFRTSAAQANGTMRPASPGPGRMARGSGGPVGARVSRPASPGPGGARVSRPASPGLGGTRVSRPASPGPGGARISQSGGGRASLSRARVSQSGMRGSASGRASGQPVAPNPDMNLDSD